MTAGADDACPREHTDQMFEALAARDKSKFTIDRANHYFSGPEGKAKLAEAANIISNWLDERGFANTAVEAFVHSN
jgi:dipeptidyl aminopeptidase/acylaminoacyl peptidase